jgi:type II secretory pathway component PulF
MTSLLIVGEESGKLDEALAVVADSYEKDTDEAIRTMSSLMEPLMILTMGLIVGFIVIAMLLPIFEINVMIR